MQLKACAGGGKTIHPGPRLVQKVAEGKTSNLFRVELESKSDDKKIWKKYKKSTRLDDIIHITQEYKSKVARYHT